jgi:hypothetical protein
VALTHTPRSRALRVGFAGRWRQCFVLGRFFEYLLLTELKTTVHPSAIFLFYPTKQPFPLLSNALFFDPTSFAASHWLRFEFLFIGSFTKYQFVFVINSLLLGHLTFLLGLRFKFLIIFYMKLQSS